MSKFVFHLLPGTNLTDDLHCERQAFNYEMKAWSRVGYHRNILRLNGIVCMMQFGEQMRPCFVSLWQEGGTVDVYMKKNERTCLLEMVKVKSVT